MIKVETVLTNTNAANIAPLLNKLRQEQLNVVDWKQESLNFVPLRGSWLAQSDADFDIEEEINKFLLPENQKSHVIVR